MDLTWADEHVNAAGILVHKAEMHTGTLWRCMPRRCFRLLSTAQAKNCRNLQITAWKVAHTVT